MIIALYKHVLDPVSINGEQVRPVKQLDDDVLRLSYVLPLPCLAYSS